MNFRTILLGSTLLLAITASFGFKASSKFNPMADWAYTYDGVRMCRAGEFTDQPICGTALTGPLCTVTPGVLPPTTAYATGGTCLYPLRQP